VDPRSGLSVVAKGKNPRCPYRELNPGRSVRRLVSVLTELPRLPELWTVQPVPLSVLVMQQLNLVIWMSLLGASNTSFYHRTYKEKVKLSPCLTKYHSVEDACGCGGIAPRILDLTSS
jgi:hypothetical protein